MYAYKNTLKGSIGIFYLILTFFLAFLCSIIPLPYNFAWLMPNWVVLVLIYWSIFLPEIVGLEFGLILGIVIDLLSGNLIGITSICLISVIFFASHLCRRFRTLNSSQQFLIILVLLSISHLIRLWLQMYIKYPTNNINYWLTVPASALIWPLICGFLHVFRKMVKF